MRVNTMNASYNEFVERVSASSDILKVISTYVPLKKRGHNYWGCCPFHSEKTPSFSVVPDEGFFYCFGCHKGGNVFKFISLIENISYGEAIKVQAERLNIPLPAKTQSKEAQKHEIERKNLYQIHELAQTFFHNCLVKTSYGKPGLAYLKKRSINSEVIEKFNLGFAPPGWDKLATAFIKRGIKKDLLVSVGLVVKKKNGGYYDRFRQRIMIPISDDCGRTVGFGARTLGNDQPKYLNSPQTSLFNKRHLLFGLHEAGKIIREKNFSIVVEGYMDAIALVSNGIHNTVASLGTAFTVEQCRKLLRYAQTIYFCYDSDRAGQNATVRALSIAHENGATTKVILIPDGKDPDEFVRKYGASAFSELIKKALNFIDFHLYHITHTIDYTTLEGKIKAVSFLLPVLASINNSVELNGYIIRIAQSLGIEETDLRTELQKYQNNKDNSYNFSAAALNRFLTKKEGSPIEKAGRYIIGKIWSEPDILDYVVSLLAIDEFDNSLHREILTFAISCEKEHKTFNKSDVTDSLSDEAAAELSRCIIESKTNTQTNLLDGYMKKIHLAFLQKSYHEHSLRADALEKKGNNGFQEELKQIQRIIKEMDEIN